jgi:hypothetical protein
MSQRRENQFVAVIIEEKHCHIKQKTIKKKKVIHVEEHHFDIPSKDDLGAEVQNFLRTLQESGDVTYIALFLNTLGQGVMPLCDKEALETYSVDSKSVNTVCVEERFLVYATAVDIKWAEKVCMKSGLDFIFSPFLVLDYFIQKEEEQSSVVTLNILYTSNALTLMVNKGEKLLYGSFFNVAKEENLLYTDYSEDEDDEGEALDEESLDALDIDEDEMDMGEIGHISDNSHFVTEVMQDHIRLSKQDERIIKYLSAALKEFYASELFESEFIQNAKIYDASGINEGVIRFIENELLLDTRAQNISVKDALLELAIKEVSQ